MRLPRFRPTTPRGAAARTTAVAVIAATGLLVGASAAAASTHTWIGPPGGAWSNVANWQEGAVPTSGEPGGTIVAINTNASSTMDIDGLVVDKLSFNGTNSTIDAAGKTLSISGNVALVNIDSAGVGNSIGVGLTLQTVGNSTVAVRSQAGQFTMNGPIAGNRPLTFATTSVASGNGTKLRGSSTFTGAVTVASGELILDNNNVNAAITGSSLQIGTGLGSGATVKLLQALEIADTTDVQLLADGTLDLGGANETIDSLEVTGGLVTNLFTGTPSLTVSALTMEGGTLGSVGANGAVRVNGDVAATSKAIGPATINAPLQVASGAFQVSDGPNAVDLLLSGANQSLGSLTVAGGAVELGTRTLTLGGALSMTGGAITGAAGAQLVLGGNVTATSGASAGAVIGVATALAGARTFTVNAGAVQPELRLGGNITNGPATGSITKVGAGTMRMQPPSGNLHTGPTAVNDGRLQINGPVTASIPTGALTIGDGTGAPGSAVVEALINDDIKAPTTVNADGLLDMGEFGQNIPSLSITDAEVRVRGSAAAFIGQLSMTGGAITGTGSLNVATFGGPPSMTLASSTKGPARIAHTGGTFINATTTMTVNAGAAPEVVIDGALQIIGGGRLIKQGTGTAQLKGSAIDQGALDVNAGTLIGEQPLLLPTIVAPGATFAPQSSIGTSTVNGTLRLGPNTAATGTLSFGPTGVLRVAVPSAIPSEAPNLRVFGTVTIASGATLDLSVASGVVLQPGTVLKLITNDLADAITGQFANAPAGPFTEPSGHALSIAYAAGTGNDLEATVVAVPPTPPTPTTPGTPSTPTAPTGSTPSTQTPIAGPPTKPASLSRLRLSPKAFRAAASGGPIAAKGSSRSTTVRFTLSSASAVEFTVSRERPGIRSGAQCVAPPKRKPAKAKRCTRLVFVGTFSTPTPAAAGDATVRFTGRLGTRALAAGNYELAARPTGGVTFTTRFTILKAARR